jgi:tetratricopeptide (TPR) repeat protein
MRTTIIIVFTLFFTSSAFAQEAKVQQWKAIVSQGKKDTTTLAALDSLQSWYVGSITDTGMFYLQQMKGLAELINDKKYIGNALIGISIKFYTAGKTVEALKMQYQALALAIEANDSLNITRGYNWIGNSHKEYGDYNKALSFYHKAYTIGILSNIEQAILTSSFNLGYVYSQLNKLDSALYFEQKAYLIGIKRNRYLTGIEKYLGDIQYKLGNTAIAKEYYYHSLVSIVNTREGIYGSRAVVWPCLGLANCYKTFGNIDSSMVFARRALAIAEKISYLNGIKDAQKILSELFDKKHQLDSLAYYQKLYIVTNDSLYNRDKSQAIESLTFEQELQAKEREVEIDKQKEERHHNIQLAITAIAILSAVILFLLLSRSIIVSHKVVEILGVIVLLVVFEFINLLLHPFLENITHHSPALMLLALVAIAALIVPLHHRLEHWTSHKLVEKNKAIRLAKAKKTIEELES